MAQRGVPRTRRSLLRSVTAILPPLLLGAVVSLLVPRPLIGVIFLTEAIHTHSARVVLVQLENAREHRQVLAVVLILDSPGGTAAEPEILYPEVMRLHRLKPFVTFVQGMMPPLRPGLPFARRGCASL